MISHLCLGTNHLPRAIRFYEGVLVHLGLLLKFSSLEQGMAAWVSPAASRPLLIVCLPFNEQAATAGNGQMVALLAPNRQAVRDAHAAALQHGAQDEGAPGLRPHYHPHYYGAYFRDLDGNKLCVCCHDPEAT